ncbi:cysteine protease domain protein [Cystoisospora suis]|uniref:Ubiquitin thioesterase OTU n=1 Tax=Cystoisospora suis TaxID=483139 RepID=A0A2C6L965_9APIC|nr:cysteine protease domain protein [Cystoisospora suis]
MGFLSALLLLAALQGCAGLALKPMCPSLQQCGRQQARQVPGAGNCLFISLAASLWWNSFGIHPDLQDHAFLDMVHSIRQTAVDTLQDPQVPTLLLEGTEEISRSRLVHLAAYEYNISPRAYCDRMRLPNTWGGGPEIVALSHALGRVIVVYEIDEQAVGSQTTSRQAADHHPLWSYLSGRSVPEPSSTAALNPALKVVACFGFPRNTAHQPLHILFTNSLACSTAGRPGSGQRADHFLPLFPCLV